ncbi:MAG TPA: AraC family transcriptional regulator [Gammaproteobacteria bacterium]|nr:AraC family transcriptional regulator [Gammaproteobacteria bacterium]
MNHGTDIERVTTIGSVAALIARALRDAGVDPAPLFKQAGIPLAEVSRPEQRYLSTRMQRLWALALEATGDACFGLKVADYVQPSALHGLGFAWVASDTLRDGLTRLVRFSRFLNSYLDIRLEERPASVDLVIRGAEHWPGFVHAAQDMGMASFLRMCRITAGEDIAPLAVHLQRPEPDCVQEFERLFRAPLTFGAVDARLCFDRAQLERPLPTPDPECARLADQTVTDYLARFDRDTLAQQVRARIIEQLPDGTPHQEEVARRLHLSLRSLQRRLRNEGTSFKHLLENTRRELALQYIRENHRSIGEITYLLGFSEPSNFTRAFRRWTGRSPLEYRESI